MTYRRRASPLHAAGAAAGISYCLALAIASLLLSNPAQLGAMVVALMGALLASGLGRALRTVLAVALPLALVIAAINALVTREGLTVILRLGELPLLGHTDITLEATAYGGVLGLRAVALLLCGALYTGAVDPDEVLRLFRPISFHSALTATLATRLVPILVRDSRRLTDAQRCRAGSPPSRFQLMRAATAGVLDRALDVAAALEVRGYGAARTATGLRRSWSRHDWAFCACAVATVGIAAGARIAGLAAFRAYPALHVPVGAAQLAVATALIVCALAPFVDRRGIVR